jgi:hypothetical protein
MVVKRAPAGQEVSVPSSASACTRQPAMARPWRRKRRGGRAGVPTQEKGQRPGLASRVTVRACWGDHLREGFAVRTVARVNANVTRTQREPVGTTRRRPRRGGFLRLEGLGLADGVRALVKAATPTRKCVPAWLDGRHQQRRPQVGRNEHPHLGGHWPKWSASVKRGGVACRRERRGSRRRCIVGEEGEVVEVGIHGGSGCPHGRHRSSRRKALPRTAPLSSFPPSPPSPPADGVCGQGRLPRCG